MSPAPPPSLPETRAKRTGGGGEAVGGGCQGHTPLNQIIRSEKSHAVN